jgi:hypothetical protein
MTIKEALATLGFVSIFHVVGGVAFGVGLRRLLRSFSCQPVFFLVWGGFFGGIPLLIGASQLLGKGQPIIFAVEAAVLLGTILVSAFVPDWIIDDFRSQNIYLMLFGAAFLFGGVIVGLSNIQEQFVTGLCLLLVFGGVGVLVIGLGLVRLLREK